MLQSCIRGRGGKRERERHKNKIAYMIMDFSYFIVNDPPVNLPVSGSRKASLRQQSVGNPTSYFIPTIFINSCSLNKNKNIDSNLPCFSGGKKKEGERKKRDLCNLHP